jgi:hypothetical protein
MIGAAWDSMCPVEGERRQAHCSRRRAEAWIKPNRARSLRPVNRYLHSHNVRARSVHVRARKPPLNARAIAIRMQAPMKPAIK